jgi:hypothetical protein
MRYNTTEEIEIGSIGVDAGIVWLGDPCYVIGEDSSHGTRTWDEFCTKLWSAKESSEIAEPLGEGVGICVSTTYGDGSYPVYGQYRNGVLVGIRVDFDPVDEECDCGR